MHTLRSHRVLTRLFVAWFGLLLGIATIAPLVEQVDYALVCSASGSTASQDEPGLPGAAHSLHCPACLPLMAGLPVAPALPQFAQVLDEPVPRALDAPRGEQHRSPFPARAPPLSLA